MQSQKAIKYHLHCVSCSSVPSPPDLFSFARTPEIWTTSLLSIAFARLRLNNDERKPRPEFGLLRLSF
jgi:hypothetical protein